MNSNEEKTEVLDIQDVDLNLTNPLVSVIIPVFNVVRYLRQALDSAINQTYKNLEIIIIDDGSNDGSETICDEYKKDPRVQVVHQENQGLSAARNVGHRMATGDYIYYLDSDDWIELHAIETMLKYAIKYDADVVTARTIMEFVGKQMYTSHTDYKIQVFCDDMILSVFAKGLVGNAAWNKLYKKHSIYDIWFPTGLNYEDILPTWNLMKKLSEKKGVLVVIENHLYHYRLRKKSITHTKTLYNIECAWIADIEKYKRLEINYLISPCFFDIGVMWANYGWFSDIDKKKAETIIIEMQCFSKKHFHKVMRNNYSLTVKFVCFLSQCKHPIILYLCWLGGRVRSYFRDKFYVKYE